MTGIDAKYIAFTGLAQVPLDIADPLDAIGRNPAERHASHEGVYCGPVLRHAAEPTQAANCRSCTAS